MSNERLIRKFPLSSLQTALRSNCLALILFVRDLRHDRKNKRMYRSIAEFGHLRFPRLDLFLFLCLSSIEIVKEERRYECVRVRMCKREDGKGIREGGEEESYSLASSKKLSIHSPKYFANNRSRARYIGHWTVSLL